MSQSSRRHASRPSRLREKLARELAKVELPASIFCGLCHGAGVDFACECDCPRGQGVVYHREACTEVWCKMCEGSGSGRVVLARALLSDPEQGFDVHAAREHALALVLYGRHAHPELPSTLDTVPALDGHDLAYTRLGQQLLDMLDAKPGSMWEHAHYQTSSCQGTQSIGRCDSMFDALTCSACQGTGHNLRGVLSAVEVTPQLRRRMSECYVPEEGEPWEGESNWLRDLALHHGVSSARTRVVARGEHCNDLKPGALSWMPKGSPRLWISEIGDGVAVRHLDPRWRRGGVKHAEQRQQAYDAAMSEHALTLADVL